MNQIQQHLEIERYVGKTYRVYGDNRTYTRSTMTIKKEDFSPCRDQSGGLNGCTSRPKGIPCNIPYHVNSRCFWRVEAGEEVK